MLSNFIRRNGKRKGNKVNESRYRRQSPLVLDINEESLSPSTAQSSLLVEINISDSNEEWFPQELLRSGSCTSASSFCRPQNSVITQTNQTQETHADSSHAPFPSQSENVSPGVVFRKKSIPAPILIPEAALRPDVQIGHSNVPTAIPSVETAQPNANDVSLNPPSSPSASDNLSAVSGSTLARALIASSFILSTTERRGSRHRSAIVRQDSATLPRNEAFFLPDSGRSSPIPPVPPVPATLVSVPSSQHHPSTIKSGASTESEYPMSDAYVTSPETPAVPRLISRIPEAPSLIAPALTKAPSSTVPDTTQQKDGLVAACTRVVGNGVFDGPQTAAEVPQPMNSQESTQHSSQEGPFLLSSDDHSLDEFDFVPPETLVAIASPDSDSSTSYVSPRPRRSDANRGQRRRRFGKLNQVRNGSKDSSLVSGVLASHQGCAIPSATLSEHDYGELLNCDLTVGPWSGTSHILSSVSAGYQTFPETPMVFSPLWSPGYTLLAKSDSQVLRRRPPSPKSAGPGPGKYSSMKNTKRQQDKSDSVDDAGVLRRCQSSTLPGQGTSSPKQVKSSLLPSVQVKDDASIPEETGQSLATNTVEAQYPVKPRSTVRPHPLARVSSSSSCLLEEEALQALARHSASSLPSIITGDVDAFASIDPSVRSPTLVPLPESTDVSPFNTPALVDGVMAASSSESPLQSSLPTASTAISQPSSSKSPLSAFSSSLGGSSFLPSPSPPASRPLSPMPVLPPTVVSDDLASPSPSPSLFPPPPYHAVVSERTPHYPGPVSPPSLSRAPSTGPGYQCSRQASNSSMTSGSIRRRVRARPPLPIGPRKPSGPGQVLGSFVPGVRGRNGSTSSVCSGDPAGNPGSLWRKLRSAASKPPPRFQKPPPKWRGLTLEAAQWTFTSAQLQEMVSQAIRQSAEGSSLRLLRLEVLEGEIADETHRLELQHTDVKAQYKALVRKRWGLMGTLASHVEGAEMIDATTASRTMEELTEVSLGLDQLAGKMHDIVLQLAQLKSLRDVHNASALAMAVRKINGVFVRQMAEKERLKEQVDVLQTERDEAWKHAEDVAQDYDTLNDRVSESVCHCGDSKVNADTQSLGGSRRSTRISAVRKSSIRQSQAGLRPRSRHRPSRSSSIITRPTSLALEDIPPVPRLLVNPSTGSATWPVLTGMSLGSVYSNNSTSQVSALEQAQREVYEMLGLSLPPSQASSRRRTMSDLDNVRPPHLSSRPVSESLDKRAPRSRENWGRATRSVVLDGHRLVLPLAVI